MAGFKVIRKKTVYKETKVQVDEEEILLPDGTIVNWPVVALPDFYFGATVKDGQAIMTKEWRQGPHDYLTQFTGARALHDSPEENIKELKRELKEELGLEGGKFKELIKFAKGTRLTGTDYYFVVTDFELGETKRDQTEFQEIMYIPVKGLYQELLQNHVVTAETLLIAKLLEERFE